MTAELVVFALGKWVFNSRAKTIIIFTIIINNNTIIIIIDCTS